MFTPYEIWIQETNGKDSPLVQIVADIGLSDEQAITTAKQRLQDVIDAIDENPGLLEVRTDVIAPVAYNIRLGRRQAELEE